MIVCSWLSFCETVCRHEKNKRDGFITLYRKKNTFLLKLIVGKNSYIPCYAQEGIEIVTYLVMPKKGTILREKLILMTLYVQRDFTKAAGSTIHIKRAIVKHIYVDYIMIMKRIFSEKKKSARR